MKRRATGEAIAAILLLAVTAATMSAILFYSGEQIFSQKETVSESISRSAKRVSELVSLTGTYADAEGVTLDLINYGKEPIRIKKVMIDGETVPAFNIKGIDGTMLEDILPVREPVTIHISGTGRTIQILTAAGNLLDFAV